MWKVFLYKVPKLQQVQRGKQTDNQVGTKQNTSK